MSVYYDTCDSPVGPLLLTTDGETILSISMDDQKYEPEIGDDWIKDEDSELMRTAKASLATYFAGESREFDLPLAPEGTAFQRRVWEELRRIPYGETISYGELARRVGNPKASRAVGLANGRNPIAIVIPCHRVIGANGNLTGYGGGLDRKAALLELETKELEKMRLNYDG